ncbi:holin-like protein [Scopulibacillus daqui]|uniref:Holin-like protein n=1 Tax=Scopulibacillus daqui TaxID=1469162 RepID=A0ABS2PYD5_9BACL|nr:CidA/LrgA family holin-like protein [Scopulibacillus daqui]MBM7644871.1 holin-like protein [Scopulibacillus daqui]
MKFVCVCLQIALLFVFYLIGNELQNLLHLPVPGSIIGMILLFLLLCFKIVPLKLVEKGSQFLLAHLPLLFIPATAGVMSYYRFFMGSGIFLFLTTILSTLIVMALAGYTTHYLSKRKSIQSASGKEDQACQKQSSQSL